MIMITIHIILFIIAAGILFSHVSVDGSKSKDKFVDFIIRFSGAYVLYIAIVFGLNLMNIFEIHYILKSNNIERIIVIERANRLSVKEKKKINKFYKEMNKIIFKEDNE